MILHFLRKKKKQWDKALKGSDSKLGPILAWTLWCFEESMNLLTILGWFDAKFTFDGTATIHVILDKHEKIKTMTDPR